NHLRDLEIPLAPLAEQRRIVAKLETMLSKVDACQQRLAKIPVLLKRFRQSVLAAACSGHLTADWREENETESVEPQLLKHAQQDKKFAEALKNGQRFKSSTPFEWAMLPELPTDWCWGAAAEVVEPGAEIVYGIVQPGPEAPNGVPYVRGLDIQNGKILVDQLRRTSREIAKRYERASLKSGDVLLGIIRHTKVAIVPSSLNGGNITQGTARFRPSELISTGFLARWLESKYAQDWLHHHYRGIDMPGLNLADVRKLPVPLPPPAEQQEIVRRVEALFALADQIEARFRKAQALVDQLTPSLLARAFRGQLVPQDPTDEPAEKLLERIRQAEPRMARITRMKRKAAGP
ncbi:MAG TPA: type I restriction endonuclease subunit S, partial [Verrucomicrobiales bacterium]|nr:type I restriction endonuclease subunit S [Verrucomicrobiales bacterium]